MSILQDELVLRRFIKMKQRSHPGQTTTPQEASIALHEQHLKTFKEASTAQNFYLAEITYQISRCVDKL